MVDTVGRPHFIHSVRTTPLEATVEDEVVGIIQYLLENPLFLAPILLIVAMMVFALLKRLVKMAAVVAIAGGLYMLLVQYFGPGF